MKGWRLNQFVQRSNCGTGVGIEPITMRNLQFQHIVLLCPSPRLIRSLRMMHLPFLLPSHLQSRWDSNPQIILSLPYLAMTYPMWTCGKNRPSFDAYIGVCPPHFMIVAERVGFEPTVPSRVLLISSQVQSASSAISPFSSLEIIVSSYFGFLLSRKPARHPSWKRQPNTWGRVGPQSLFPICSL